MEICERMVEAYNNDYRYKLEAYDGFEIMLKELEEKVAEVGADAFFDLSKPFINPDRTFRIGVYKHYLILEKEPKIIYLRGKRALDCEEAENHGAIETLNESWVMDDEIRLDGADVAFKQILYFFRAFMAHKIESDKYFLAMQEGRKNAESNTI